MCRCKGFSLLEVLISALLIMVGLGALGVTVVAGKRFLRQAEYRSQAMSLASTKMQTLLAKGYNIMNGTTNGTIGSEPEGSYNWRTNVTESNKTGTKATIPHKDIVVVVSYDEEDGSGGLDSKNIRLTNIIPYPLMHTESTNTTCRVSAVCDNVPPHEGNLTTTNPEKEQYEVVRGEDNLTVSFNYAVKKNIAMAYSISIRADEADDTTASGEIDFKDTIYSTFFLDDEMTSPPAVARTPIMSQPTFNNADAIKGVLPGPHTISVGWVKITENKGTSNITNSAGKIWLIDGSLTIIATEVK